MMKYSRVFMNAIAYELAPVVVTSDELEERLTPVYQKLHIPRGQLRTLTGIEQRRWWHEGFDITDGAVSAASKAIAGSGINKSDIGAIVYTGVSREVLEPAMACRVAHRLGIGGDVVLHDLGNACLGMISGVLDVANRIELGQIKAGLVVSCESARHIVEAMMDWMLASPDMATFARFMGNLTGGSGAAAILLSDGSLNLEGQAHRLLGGLCVSLPQFHDDCHWRLEPVGNHQYKQVLQGDGVKLLKHGEQLALETRALALKKAPWLIDRVDKIICHQVGESNERSLLSTLGIPPEKNYSSFRYLGNMGTVSVPVTAAQADENGFFCKGDRVILLASGSGLSSIVLSIEW